MNIEEQEILIQRINNLEILCSLQQDQLLAIGSALDETTPGTWISKPSGIGWVEKAGDNNSSRKLRFWDAYKNASGYIIDAMAKLHRE